MSTEEKPPFDTPYEWIGGETAVRRLVDRFYDLMDLEPAYTELRAAHGSTLEDARDKLFWFLCGWMGGPDYFQERFGHPRLRMRHMPYVVNPHNRDVWLAHMNKEIDQLELPMLHAETLREYFDRAAHSLLNASS